MAERLEEGGVDNVAGFESVVAEVACGEIGGHDGFAPLAYEAFEPAVDDETVRSQLDREDEL